MSGVEVEFLYYAFAALKTLILRDDLSKLNVRKLNTAQIYTCSTEGLKALYR